MRLRRAFCPIAEFNRHPQILANSTEVSTTTFVKPATAAVELAETTVDVWRVSIIWLNLEPLV